MSPPWTPYLGLPHVLAADPRDGVGADCLLLVLTLLDDAGIPRPPLPADLFPRARQGDLHGLYDLWARYTIPLEEPEDYGVTLLPTCGATLGVAIRIQGHLILVHHRRGVMAVPLQFLRPLSFRKFVV